MLDYGYSIHLALENLTYSTMHIFQVLLLFFETLSLSFQKYNVNIPSGLMAAMTLRCISTSH
uniref:Uncharacterized protein n=1 Tax=Solanum tuberosum TaxID=4113 RepID=M0ZVW4_SOLTU